MLSERKKQILRAVIDEYIDVGEPVSSKSIQNEYLNGVSSATIRNELKTLEDMGYLYQPHTSSGRIPSNKAYEYYFNKFLTGNAKSLEEVAMLESYFKEEFQGLEDVLSRCVKVISDLTTYTSIAKVSKGEVFKTLKLVSISEESILLVMITENGNVKNSTINGVNFQSDEILGNAEKILNDSFIGKELKNILDIEMEVLEKFHNYKDFIEKVFEAMKKNKMEEENLFLSGEENIFQHKDYKSVEQIKDFMATIGKKENLKKILDVDTTLDINITIGCEENGISGNCSVVSASVEVKGEKIASYGVIGPTRMDYEKVINVLSSVGTIIKTVATEKLEDKEKKEKT